MLQWDAMRRSLGAWCNGMLSEGKKEMFYLTTH